MENLDNKENCYSTHGILKFIAHVLCIKGEHVQGLPYVCRQHPTLLYNCKLCEGRSIWCHYTYQCKICLQYLCFSHFIDHTQLFRYCQTHQLEIDCKSNEIKIEPSHCKSVSLAQFHKISFNLVDQFITLKIDTNDSKFKSNICKNFVNTNFILHLRIMFDWI